MNRHIIKLILISTIQHLDYVKKTRRRERARYHVDAVNVAADAGVSVA